MALRSSTPLTQRARRIISKLKQTYPEAHCELSHSNPLQLLIATILSAQCTDERVNKVTPALFSRCHTARDYAEIPVAELEDLIRTTGFFRSKAKSIRGCAASLVKEHGGEVPRTMEHLNKLPGVGRKTANVVLGNAFNLAEGIVVDRLEDVGPALQKAIDMQMNERKTCVIEIMCTRELGDPFRRDALSKPVRFLDKYKDYT